MIAFIASLFFLPLNSFCENPVQYSQDTTYAFIVAGHGYGSHDGTNPGLHTPFLNSLDSGYDPEVEFIVLTGDIVRTSTTQSWGQVSDELSEYPLSTYYSLGNHDDNDAGHQEFNDKFGGLYYSFHFNSDLFIVLNSIESDRSISATQLDFLANEINITGDTCKRVFIFFHELIWNSLEKYIDVRSNSRSRYDQMVDHSNYWEEVHPMLLSHPEKEFYLIAGDVGGNEDAIAAFYDKWENVTFIASGMGEVADENYLLVKVQGTDSLEMELIPLDPELKLPELKYFSVPSSPDSIHGLAEVRKGTENVEYSVSEIPLATSYMWDLPDGMNGSGNSNSITVTIDSDFSSGLLSLHVEKDGFGVGPAVSKSITGLDPPVWVPEQTSPTSDLTLRRYQDFLIIELEGIKGGDVYINIMDGTGRITKSITSEIKSNILSQEINIGNLPKGLHIITVQSDDMIRSCKFIHY